MKKNQKYHKFLLRDKSFTYSILFQTKRIKKKKKKRARFSRILCQKTWTMKTRMNFFFDGSNFEIRIERRSASTSSEGNEILIFKPSHDTISVISIEATVGRRTRDGWNINADISLLCGSLTTPPSDSSLSRLRFPPWNDIALGHSRRDTF